MNTVQTTLLNKIAVDFVSNCDPATLNHVRKFSDLRLIDIDADEALYQYNEFDSMFDDAINDDGLQITNLGNQYCDLLSKEFLKQHNIVVKFS